RRVGVSPASFQQRPASRGHAHRPRPGERLTSLVELADELRRAVQLVQLNERLDLVTEESVEAGVPETLRLDRVRQGAEVAVRRRGVTNGQLDESKDGEV